MRSGNSTRRRRRKSDWRSKREMQRASDNYSSSFRRHLVTRRPSSMQRLAVYQRFAYLPSMHALRHRSAWQLPAGPPHPVRYTSRGLTQRLAMFAGAGRFYDTQASTIDSPGGERQGRERKGGEREGGEREGRDRWQAAMRLQPKGSRSFVSGVLSTYRPLEGQAWVTEPGWSHPHGTISKTATRRKRFHLPNPPLSAIHRARGRLHG
mmetsp:Transcript_9446/g.21306  ORF Transcript_9446/g.21306 Transcript_9446/m.21306 type:complete len:208 (-) Transcript_9446:320-943(-)